MQCINTLLGAPRKLICQCCGMPIWDEAIGRESDGTLNENFSEKQAHVYMKEMLPKLDYWKIYDDGAYCLV